jgi:hypothetical protein
MNVKELRERLAVFDDDTQVFVAPQLNVEMIDRGGIDVDMPHPTKHYEIKRLHVVGDVEAKTGKVGKRYVVLAFPDPEAVEQNSVTTFSESPASRMRWSVQTRGKLVRVKLQGQFSVEGIQALTDGLTKGGYFDRSSLILFDDRELELRKVNYSELMTASNIFLAATRNKAGGRHAFLMGNNDAYRIAREWETITGPHTTVLLNVFLDEAEAVDWLTKPQSTTSNPAFL